MSQNALKCPTCENALPVNANYCPNCGKPIDKRENQASVGRSHWLGERRQVTILFADLGSFTAASEKSDPEDVIDMLNTVFTRLMRECEEEGGHLDKTVGDELMVLFGAPKAHEDDPTRAVRAALKMQEVMRKLNSFMRQKVGRICDINIGINTGSVVWGELGPSGHTALTVIGDAVNLAARLENYATGGRIVISESTYRRTQEQFEFETLPPISVKGKSGRIPIYTPLAIKLGAPKAQDEIGNDIPFIGREQELDLLHAFWSRSGAGYPQVVSLVGEAGLGKTRLVSEFVDSLKQYSRAKQPLILQTRQRIGSHSDYHPLADIASQYFGLVPNDTEIIRRRKIEDRIQALGITSNKFLPLMGYLLNWYQALDNDTTPENQQNLDYLRFAAIDAAVDLFYKQASRRPTLLVIDDIQSADDQITEWLNRLIIASKMIQPKHDGYRLMVLTISRPQFGTAQIGNAISLAPLSDSEQQQFISHILPGEGLPASLTMRLSKESEGNPFYLLEVARELIQSGQLVRSGNRWQLTRAVDQLDVPHSIEGLVLAKLDTLSANERRTLQHASVIGLTFSEKLLASITPIDNLKGILTNLVKQGLIKEVGLASSSPSYAFAQAVTREVTYDSILRKTRRELHELIADLTAKDNITPVQSIENLAQEYATKGQNEKMIVYNWLAGRHALERFQFDVAFHHLQLAWDTMLEMSNPNPDIYQSLAELLGDASTFTNHYTLASTCYQTAWSLIKDDPKGQADIHHKLGRLRFYQGDINAALEDYYQALEVTAKYPYPQLRAQVEAEMRLLFDLG